MDLIYYVVGNFNNNRSDRDRSGENRGFKSPQMHNATCSKCGKSCLVPFRPTGNRPIFCSDCFKTEGGQSARRNDDRTPQASSDRRMYDAICDKCGNRCQIPFQPRQGKPVFCSHCFEQNEREDGTTSEKPRNNYEFDALNVKLDRILELLSERSSETNSSKKPVVQEVADQELLKVEVEEPKKEVVKKAPAKRKVASKKKTPVEVE